MSELEAEGRRGRKTKEEEARDYIASLGLDPDEVFAGTPGDAFPETPEEMQKAFLRIMWSRRKTMTDTAFTQAVRALGQLVAAAPPEEKVADEPLVADVIAGIVLLPVGRKKQILRGALVELDAERARIMEVLSAV